MFKNGVIVLHTYASLSDTFACVNDPRRREIRIFRKEITKISLSCKGPEFFN
jgi:hypothetical protein